MILMNDGLIKSIGEKLNIPKSDDYEWFCQIIYSVAGQMALASLWDHEDDGNTVSVQYFKTRIAQIIQAYEDIYPNVQYLFPEDTTDLIQDIYSIYLKTGHLYHSSHQLAPATPAKAGFDNVTLYRGISPGNNLHMSGLGFYAIEKDNSGNSIASLFDLQTTPYDTYLEELLEHGEWEPIVWPESSQFLRIDPPFSRGYWDLTPNNDSRISIARFGEPKRIYGFYRYYDGKYQYKAIPEWRVLDYNSSNISDAGYRRIATALLMRYHNLPSIQAYQESNLIKVKLGYRLPPQEENFFKLYSWPDHYIFNSQSPQVFTRKMTTPIYHMFKHEMEIMGYHFLEE